jgi:endonuclease/exonuclease/phosphatase family metal-dependent hydrolase
VLPGDAVEEPRHTDVVRRLLLAGLIVLAGCSSDESSPRPAAAPRGRLSIVSLNVLHGAMCPTESQYCQVHERIQLLARHVTEAGCPDVVALQEVSPWVRVELEGIVGSICSGRYRLVPGQSPALDAEQVLTTRPVLGHARVPLPGPQRTALWVRVRGALGPVDVVVTHIGAGADGQGQGGVPCNRDICPPSCPTGTPVVSCQVRRALAVLEGHRREAGVGVLTGDFNVVPGSPPYRLVTKAGLLDTYLEAGRPECDPATSAGCTGGRDDRSLAALRDLASGEGERIDYMFLAPGGCRPAYGPATGLFAEEPVTDGPGGLAWPSDHVGTALDLTCA